jgi:two-component system, sensor histidine kinase and response regulator
MLHSMELTSAPDREDLLARVFDGSAQGILVARLADGRIVRVNDAFLYLVGRDVDEVVGLTTAELGVFSELGDEHARRRLLERGGIDGFDTHIATPSGETRVLRLWAEAIGDAIDGLVVVRASDMHGRAAAGARYYELREAEVRYRALVEQIPAITYTQVEDEASPTGFRVIYISPQASPLLGCSPLDWQDDPALWLRRLHPEDRERVRLGNLDGAKRGARFTTEYRMIAHDGREVWFRDEAVRIEDPISGVSFWQGVMLDITSQKRAAEHHAELEAKYRTLVEQLPSVVYLGEYGQEGDWLYISPRLEAVLGYTPQEWLAHPHPMGSFVHPDDLERVWVEERRSQREHDAFRCEYRIQAKDGAWVWIHDEATAVLDEQGRPFVLQGTLTDVTERKRAEQELADALERLQALDRLKNTLLHTLSHDLKAPLTAILGAASTLRRLDQELPDEQRRTMLETLQRRTEGMNALLTDLLDLDRLEQGILEPRRFPVDLEDLVRHLVEASEGLRLRDVCLDTERVVVPVDRTKVERMIDNLLANAALHTPAECRVWVRVRACAGGAEVLVEDDGPGVPDALKQSVFETFRRGPDSERIPGTGIGLSLVARFAELHGGNVWVEDRAGGGASFHVFLPAIASGLMSPEQPLSAT